MLQTPSIEVNTGASSGGEDEGLMETLAGLIDRNSRPFVGEQERTPAAPGWTTGNVTMEPWYPHTFMPQCQADAATTCWGPTELMATRVGRDRRFIFSPPPLRPAAATVAATVARHQTGGAQRRLWRPPALSVTESNQNR